MTEQELADLFSEQLDRLLLGGETSVPTEAVELNELLSLGHQFAGVQFPISSTAAAAFKGQLATWFGVGVPAVAAGIPMALLVRLIVAAIVISTLLSTVLTVFNTDPPPVVFEPIAPPPAQFNHSDLPADAAAPATTTTDVLPQPKKSSQGESLNLPGASSQGDTLEITLPPLENTVITNTTPLTDDDTTDDIFTGEPGSGDDTGTGTDSSDDSSSGDDTFTGDDDRGHGNDPGGYDPDNPGQSTGVGGGAVNVDRGDNNAGGNSSSNSSSSNAGGNDKANSNKDKKSK